jgi:hypothetical protein
MQMGLYPAFPEAMGPISDSAVFKISKSNNIFGLISLFLEN